MLGSRKSLNAMMLGATMMAAMAGGFPGYGPGGRREEDGQIRHCKSSVTGTPKKLKKRKKGNFFSHTTDNSKQKANEKRKKEEYDKLVSFCRENREKIGEEYCNKQNSRVKKYNKQLTHNSW